MRNFEELCNQFSGTVFLVGSGPSLHFQDLDFLKSQKTMAVNAGCLRISDVDWVLTDDEDSSHWTIFYENLRKSQNTQVLLYEDKYRKFGNLKECQEWFGDRLVLFQHGSSWKLTDTYKHNSKEGLWRARCSAVTCIDALFSMGFRRIILLGIDCVLHQGKRYFYEFPGWQKPSRRIPFFQRRWKKKFKEKETHQDLIEICDDWKRVAKETKGRCKIYNASHLSILDMFPKMDLGEFQCTKTEES